MAYPEMGDIQKIVDSAVAETQYPAEGARKVFIDFTDTCSHSGKPFGIVRVETGYVLECALSGAAIPVVWNKTTRSFIQFPYETVASGTYKQYLANARHDILIIPQGAILIVPGCHWWVDSDYRHDLIGLTRQRNVILVPFIYDVTWSKFSHWMSVKDARHYSDCARLILENASLAIAISESTARDIPEFCDKVHIKCPPIRVCLSGDTIEKADSAINEKYTRLSKGPGYVLCVCALHPHKNHELLLNVWRALIEKNGPERCPLLVCVGYPCSATRAFVQSAFRDARIRRHIKLLHGISESVLNWLYKNSLFTVYPSLYEGWGLPVAESLCHGKVVVASNAGSIPEIAPRLTDLIDPLDFPAWLARINAYIFNPELRMAREREIKAYIPRTWQDSVASLLSHISASSLNPSSIHCLSYGKQVNTEREIEKYLGAGWQTLSANGLMSRSRIASLIFSRQQPDQDANLVLSARASAVGTELRIRINGYPVSSFVFSDLEWNEIVIKIAANPDSKREIEDTVIDFCLTQTRDVDNELYIRSFSLVSQTCDATSAAVSMDMFFKSFLSTASPLREIAKRREDVRTMMSEESGLLKTLLWAWRYGIGEEPDLGRHWRNIRNTFSRLHELPASNSLVKEYTALIQFIWASRPDLHFMDTGTAEGQKAAVEWFNSNGISEYGLEEIADPANVFRNV